MINSDELNNNNLNRSNFNYPSRSTIISNDQHLILNLQRIWTNEKFSKELLKYEEEFISEVINLVEKKESELNRTSQIKDFADILELDIDRIKFLLKDYFRIRLSKIDKYIYYIIKNDLTNILSKTEYEFAADLYKLKKNYFYDGINKKLPDLFNDFKNYPQSEEIIVTPPLNYYVCFKSQTYEPIAINMRDVWEDSNETLLINREDIYSLPYVLIK